MTTPVYLSIIGTTQGFISENNSTQESVGSQFQKVHRDKIKVHAFSHGVSVPYDQSSGQLKGQRLHGPLMISKEFDKTSPLLFSALTSGEVLECKLEFYRTSPVNAQEYYYTIELDEAHIVDIQSRMPHFQDPDKGIFPHMEDVYFSFRKIQWTHEISTTSAIDDWREQKTN